jgi:hypothetical protein
MMKCEPKKEHEPEVDLNELIKPDQEDSEEDESIN